MKKKALEVFKIPCSWEMYGVLRIEAKSLEEAIEKAKKEQDTCSLPDGDYIDASFKLDLEDLALMRLMNKKER